MAEALSRDTQAALLLCGHFGKVTAGAEKPLSVAEYGRLAKWLQETQVRPGDLLDFSESDLKRVVDAKLDAARVKALLGRGAAMALATEKWLRSGLWVLSRGDAAYPKRLKKRLGMDAAPPLLYGAGDPELLSRGGLAIVGSRNASDAALEFVRELAARCGKEGIAVVSGGARGVDQAAMQAAGEAGSVVIGVLADSLLTSVRNRENRLGIEEKRLVLCSPFYPEAGFNAGNAMARNRYVYTIADHALVAQSDLNKGGTWAGAAENLRERWVPLFVRRDPEAAGNGELIKRGALPFDFDLRGEASLQAFLDSSDRPTEAEGLFAPPVTQPATVGEQRGDYQATVDGHDQAGAGVKGVASAEQSVELDMYAEFLRRLVPLLQEGALPQKEIAARLGLTAAQAKAWLVRAEGEGHVEHRAKTKKYSLPELELFR